MSLFQQQRRPQGNYVGRTIAREYAKRPARPYRYTPLGHLALLGHYVGVAEIGPFRFEGFPAFLLWHLTYLVRNPSWRKRIRLVVDWTLSALLGREIGELRLDTEQAAEQRVLETRT
jgi:NADH dehydrogenase